MTDEELLEWLYADLDEMIDMVGVICDDKRTDKRGIGNGSYD